MKPPRRPTRWVAALAGVAFGLTGGIYLLLRDEVPPEDSDLGFRPPGIPEAANGFPLLRLSEEEVFWPDDEFGTRLHLDGPTFDGAFAGELLARNESALRRLADALARPEFLAPAPAGPESDVAHLRAWRKIMHLLSCRTTLQLERGNESQALADALTLVRFGRRVYGSRGGRLHSLFGLAMIQTGCKRLLYLAPRTRPGHSELKALLAELALLQPDVGGRQRSFYPRLPARFHARATPVDGGDAGVVTSAGRK